MMVPLRALSMIVCSLVGPSLVVVGLFVAVPVHGAPHPLFRKAMTLLNDELVDSARAAIDAYEEEQGESVSVILLRARLEFLEGNYMQSLERFNQARGTDSGFDEALWEPFEMLVQATWRTTQDYVAHPTSGGHFVIYTRPGVDEVLIPYADDALERAYEVFGEIFGYRPSDPVIVHVYPRVEDLGTVSSLKVSEIQTSGTIALCKYNRLMITSPRDLLFGYDWLDTLAHEYIHYVITKRSHNTVPIWLHEGLAKFFESRWRNPKDEWLSPTSQDHLKRGLKNKRLISFEEMSPSMAKLPSQEDTSLAFAEVFTVIHFIKKQFGMQGIEKLLDLMKGGVSDKDAIAQVSGTSFENFQQRWKRHLRGVDLLELPGGYSEKLYFKNRDKKDDSIKDIGQEDAEKHTYLGDRLRAKERLKAAAKEYEKAVALVGNTSPVIQSKLGATWLSLGEADKALKAVLAPLKFYPDYVLLYFHAGRAFLAQRDYTQAASYLEKALRINPFDPEIHSSLVKAYQELGRVEEAKREQAALRILSSEH